MSTTHGEGVQKVKGKHPRTNNAAGMMRKILGQHDERAFCENTLSVTMNLSSLEALQNFAGWAWEHSNERWVLL